MSSLTYIPGFLWNFDINRFISIMQIRHILIKYHIYIFSSETAEHEYL
jgi:hypothetical protein